MELIHCLSMTVAVVQVAQTWERELALEQELVRVLGRAPGQVQAQVVEEAEVERLGLCWMRSVEEVEGLQRLGVVLVPE